MKVQGYTEPIKLALKTTNRTTNTDIVFMAMTGVMGGYGKFSSKYDGHLGFGPWQAKKEFSDYNFMNQIKK